MAQCGILALVALLAASIVQCAKIHEQMTDEEIANLFHTTRDNVPEYEVVTIRHNLYKRSSSHLQLEFSAFGRQINAFLEPSGSALATTNTPVWLAFTISDGTVEYKKLRDDIMGLVDGAFHSGIDLSSVISIQQKGENASFEGVVHDMKIRSLPKRFREASRSGREIESPKKSRTLVETHHHVIIKSSSSMKENEELRNLGRRIHKTRTSSEAIHSKSKRSLQETVYPSILVTTDYAQSKTTLNDIAYYDEIVYQLAFWNAVDLRFRHVNDPKIRLHIAGIVIALDRRATPYLDRCRTGNEIAIGSNWIELTMYWSAAMKPSAFSRQRYDIVVSITDNDIMKIPNRGAPHRISGTTSYGTLCSREINTFEALAVVHDRGGFSGVWTAAHELGHILGTAHDGKRMLGDQPAYKCDEMHGYIMTPARKPGPNNFDWSSCSLKRLSNFLRHREINCIDKPGEIRNPALGRSLVSDEVPIRRLLPGDIADAHKQCQGRGYQWACATAPEMCSNMQCYYTAWTAFVYGWWCQYTGPAFDGTRCSPGHKCLNGVCQCFTEECIFNKTLPIV